MCVVLCYVVLRRKLCRPLYLQQRSGVDHPVLRQAQHTLDVGEHLLVGQAVRGVAVLHVEAQCEDDGLVDGMQIGAAIDHFGTRISGR